MPISAIGLDNNMTIRDGDVYGPSADFIVGDKRNVSVSECVAQGQFNAASSGPKGGSVAPLALPGTKPEFMRLGLLNPNLAPAHLTRHLDLGKQRMLSTTDGTLPGIGTSARTEVSEMCAIGLDRECFAASFADDLDGWQRIGRTPANIGSSSFLDVLTRFWLGQALVSSAYSTGARAILAPPSGSPRRRRFSNKGFPTVPTDGCFHRAIVATNGGTVK